MNRERITGLCTYQIRTLDSRWVVAVDPKVSCVIIGADRAHAVTWLRTPEQIDGWVAEVQKLIPSVTLRAERAR